MFNISRSFRLLSLLLGIPVLMGLLFVLGKYLYPHGDYGGWHQMAEDVILKPGIRADAIAGIISMLLGFGGSPHYGVGGGNWLDHTIIVLFSWLFWMSPLFVIWFLWRLWRKKCGNQ